MTAGTNAAPAAAATPAIDAGTVPRIGPGFRLQFEQAQGCQVLLYPEGMVKLNGSAGEIMQRCDGQRSVGAITAELEAAFAATGLERDVLGFVQMAVERRWLVVA